MELGFKTPVGVSTLELEMFKNTSWVTPEPGHYSQTTPREGAEVRLGLAHAAGEAEAVTANDMGARHDKF
eukprot:CAMPEP_0119110224 /NCGR_PEP_ID=MMETSP1180-20130426/27854_1 /TAXON_ID=3052 ORGANISM="Chlamydomonas cf sp, Strain CCMP681" /NCGR_SAMPLE_ID=MMETSP1180 /ASSEMBLY_ACC=CAM_ASM_000741 /LENGTH=69 /DNA_ID=CAMNT_0007096433 /DNA_START=96 /DNA_END=304 /DNA_ORIENTATION=+